jgi:uncharacterized membrane protein YdfJ with MMPL/SSD domain
LAGRGHRDHRHRTVVDRDHVIRPGSFLPQEYESVQAIDIAKKAVPQQTTSTAIIVVKRSDGQPLTTTDQAKVDQTAQALLAKNIPHTSGWVTGPPAVAPDKSIQIINVGLQAEKPDDPALLDAVRQMRTDLGIALAGTGLTAGVAGDVASFVDNQDTFNSAFAIVGTATIVPDHRIDSDHLPQPYRGPPARVRHRHRLHRRHRLIAAWASSSTST